MIAKMNINHDFSQSDQCKNQSKKENTNIIESKSTVSIFYQQQEGSDNENMQ